MSITFCSARHHLVDLDYEARGISALLQDFDNARAVTKRLEPKHFAHPHFAAIFLAICALEAAGRTPSIPAVRELLVARGAPAAVPWIAVALDNYIPSSDGPRLHLFVERILRLAELRWLLALADRVEVTLADRRLDRSSRIEAAHEEITEALRGLSAAPGGPAG